MSEASSDPPGSADDDDRHLLAVPRPEWLRYEADVAGLVAEMDPNVVVEHNRRLLGKQSKRLRQVDVFVTGTVAGQQMTIAIECKRHKKAIGIGTVDEFAGKLLDLGVDRGVLYAFTGFGAGAAARAAGALQPRIELRNLAQPLAQLPSWADRLPNFTGFGDCPNENCYTGDINWARWPQADTDLLVEAGSCGTCGTWAVRCVDCGSENGFVNNQLECEGCGLPYILVWDRKGADVEDVLLSSKAIVVPM